jgi:Phage integrase, N-terminal SAM-like domain
MTDEVISPLRRRMIEDMTIRKFAAKTQHDYVQRVKHFATFLGRSPTTASREDVRRYQLHLASSGAHTRGNFAQLRDRHDPPGFRDRASRNARSLHPGDHPPISRASAGAATSAACDGATNVSCAGASTAPATRDRRGPRRRHPCREVSCPVRHLARLPWSAGPPRPRCWPPPERDATAAPRPPRCRAA